MIKNTQNNVLIENTNFIWRTNFSGEPDRFGNTKKKASIIVPDVDLAMDLMGEGFNVKTTKPREGEEEGFVPKYFIDIQARYGSKKPPEIFLGSEDTTYRLLDEETVGEIDHHYILNVDVTLNKYEKNGNKSFYIDIMYVTYDVTEDPFAHKYRRD